MIIVPRSDNKLRELYQLYLWSLREFHFRFILATGEEMLSLCQKFYFEEFTRGDPAENSWNSGG